MTNTEVALTAETPIMREFKNGTRDYAITDEIHVGVRTDGYVYWASPEGLGLGRRHRPRRVHSHSRRLDRLAEHVGRQLLPRPPLTPPRGPRYGGGRTRSSVREIVLTDLPTLVRFYA